MSDEIEIELPEDAQIVDIRADGILWMINRVIFHPRGFTLGYDEDNRIFILQGNGKEVWTYADILHEIEQNLFDKFEEMLTRQRKSWDER